MIPLTDEVILANKLQAEANIHRIRLICIKVSKKIRDEEREEYIEELDFNEH